MNNYDDPKNVRDCFLVGLTDLYGKLDYVRDAVASYFNQLIDFGVAGIRIDAAKHMWPAVSSTFPFCPISFHLLTFAIGNFEGYCWNASQSQTSIN